MSPATIQSPRPIRWGIVATGGIARAFATDLRLVPDAVLGAVGSRSLSSARAFAAQYGVERAHGSYEALVADPEIDVVYVASPHSHHREHGLLALAAGKPVLVEKPFAMTAAEGEELATAAREAGLFCMEAMWMACHPVIRAVRDGLAAGRFGEPRQVTASLGFRVAGDPSRRMVDLALGAGSLLDMGVYPLTFANLMLGPPSDLEALATLSPTGYDEDIAIIGRHRPGALSLSSASMTSQVPRTAAIATTEGRIDLPLPFHHAPYATWTPLVDGRESGAPERIDGLGPLIGTGLGNEAAEVMRCLRAGETESPLVPLDRTLAIMRQMDQIRAQVGLRYAADG